MMVTLKTGIIGVHFFCFRTINDVACVIEKGFEVCPIDQDILERELATQGASSEDSLVAQLVPEADVWLDLLTKLRQGGEIAPHEAHDLPQSPDTVLGLTHSLGSPCHLFGSAVEWREVEAESHALFVMLADIPLPIRTIAAHEQPSVNQTGNVPAHRGAGHAVQPLADRLVGREDDHFCVSAKRIIRKEAEKPLQNGQIALGNPKGGLRLGQLAKELPLVDGLARNRRLRPLDHAQMGVRDRPHKRRNRYVLHDVIHEGIEKLFRESHMTCGLRAGPLP